MTARDDKNGSLTERLRAPHMAYGRIAQIRTFHNEAADMIEKLERELAQAKSDLAEVDEANTRLARDRQTAPSHVATNAAGPTATITPATNIAGMTTNAARPRPDSIASEPEVISGGTSGAVAAPSTIAQHLRDHDLYRALEYVRRLAGIIAATPPTAFKNWAMGETKPYEIAKEAEEFYSHPRAASALSATLQRLPLVNAMDEALYNAFATGRPDQPLSDAWTKLRAVLGVPTATQQLNNVADALGMTSEELKDSLRRPDGGKA